MFVSVFRNYKQAKYYEELQKLLNEIEIESRADDAEGTRLIREYPELKKSWSLYCRVQNLYFNYDHCLKAKLPRKLSYFKALRRYKIKVEYLKKLKKKRLEEYQFLKKLVIDY